MLGTTFRLCTAYSFRIFSRLQPALAVCASHWLRIDLYFAVPYDCPSDPHWRCGLSIRNRSEHELCNLTFKLIQKPIINKLAEARALECRPPDYLEEPKPGRSVGQNDINLNFNWKSPTLVSIENRSRLWYLGQMPMHKQFSPPYKLSCQWHAAGPE